MISPTPWYHEIVQLQEDRSAYSVVKDNKGKIICDTMNSEVAEIHTEHDEDGVHRWDEQGRQDLSLMVLAPEMLAVLKKFVTINMKHGYEFDSNEPELYKKITDVILKANI